MRIGGSAKELIRELDVNILSNGMAFPDGQGNLIPHTGLECLIRALNQRFGPMQQELEIHVISEILHFRRQPGEDTDAVISRFELIRDRALQGANFDMSWVGFAFLLLSILGIPKNQWPLLLAPTQGALPADQAQYTAFCRYVRRQGHLYDRNVDQVKNMTFYTGTGADTQAPTVAFPAFAPWNLHEQPETTPLHAFPEYAYPAEQADDVISCLLYTSPSPRDS